MGVGLPRWLLLFAGLTGLVGLQGWILDLRKPAMAQAESAGELRVIDQRWLASSGNSRHVRVWRLDDSSFAHEIATQNEGSRQRQIWPASGTLYLNTVSSNAEGYDLATGALLFSTDLPGGRAERAVAANVAGDRLVTVFEDRALRMVDAQTGAIDAEFVLFQEAVSGRLETMQSFAFGNRILLQGEGGRVFLFELDRDGEPREVGSLEKIRAVEWSEDGTRAALRDDAGVIVIDTAAAQVIASLQGISPRHSLVAFDGENLATGDVSEAVIWNVGTGVVGQRFNFRQFYESFDGRRGLSSRNRQAQYQWDLSFAHRELVVTSGEADDLAVIDLDSLEPRFIRARRDNESMPFPIFRWTADGRLFIAAGKLIDLVEAGAVQKRSLTDPRISEQSVSPLMWIYRLAAMLIALLVAAGLVSQRAIWDEHPRYGWFFALFHSSRGVLFLLAVPALIFWIGLTMFMFENDTGSGIMTPGVASALLFIVVAGALAMLAKAAAIGAHVGMRAARLLNLSARDLFVSAALGTFGALLLVPLLGS